MLLNILIAISLSMDAFALSLVYGNLNISKKDICVLSTIVGLYHLFMPILGMYFGEYISNFILIDHNIIMFIILFIVGIEMIIEAFKKENNIKNMKLVEQLLFGFAVSIDSFSIGIGLKYISNDYISGPITFSIASALFTFIGLKIGKYMNTKIGNISRLFGGILLIVLAITYL